MSEIDEAVDGPDEPRLRSIGAALLLLEAVLLLAAVAALVIDVFAARDRTVVAALAAVVLLMAGGLGVCARGVARRRRWARAPAITWQLLQAFVALPSVTGGFWFVGGPLVVLSVVVVLILIRPGVIPPR